jgi:hypothetical protein
LWATQLAYINHENQALLDPRVWAPYVLIEQESSPSVAKRSTVTPTRQTRAAALS